MGPEATKSALAPAHVSVLVVDDNEANRALAQQTLEDEGYTVRLASDGASGLAAFADGAPPDCVLLDVRMPGIDGIEVAQHLQGMTDPPAVIFTTAYDAYAIKAFEVHAVDYLLKPIRAARLADALVRARAVAPVREDVLRELRPGPRTNLSVHERGRIHLIPADEILFLKAELKYVTVRTAAREYLLEESLTRLEQEFATQFVRIHRNCLVARAAIRGFERVVDESEGHWVVVLEGLDERLAVSRRQNHVVREFVR
jgi:two-component system response regulator AlgR